MSPKALALSCLLALLLSACGEKSESWKKVTDTGGATWDAVKTWSAEKSVEARIALQKKMDDLGPKLKIAREAAKRGGSAVSEDLEQKVAETKVALKVLKAATADTWADALAGFKRAWEALSTKIKSLTD